MLLTIAGLASAFCSFIGGFGWMWSGAGKSHSIVQMLFFLLPALSLPIFVLYLLLPLAGLTAAWLLPSSTYICLFLMNLASMKRSESVTKNPLYLAWNLIWANERLLGLLLVSPVCMLLDYTAIPLRNHAPVSGPEDIEPFNK